MARKGNPISERKYLSDHERRCVEVKATYKRKRKWYPFCLYLLIVFLPLLGSSVAGFFGRFLGSEGTAITPTGRNIVLFAILLLGLIFLFRLFCLRLNKKDNFRLVFFLYLSFLFVVSFFCYSLRICLFSHLGIDLFSFLILSVGGGQALPLPAPSSPSHSSSWKEDSFEIGVLLEPFSETDIEDTSGNPPLCHNHSFETSLQNRISRLQRENSIFLLDKSERYWNDIKAALDQAHSQSEYNRLLHFENRDLQIRELKHSCFSQFQQVLAEQPALAEKASYNPQEALLDFFDEKRDELDTHLEWNIAKRDGEEILFLDTVGKDLRNRGPSSPYMKKILGLE